jgi:hypothetical protein
VLAAVICTVGSFVAMPPGFGQGAGVAACSVGLRWLPRVSDIDRGEVQ